METDWRSDRSLAYALFRFTFGVNIMMRGVVRIVLGRAAFIGYMLAQFKDVPVMSPALLVPFATVLPWVEATIGLLILIGFKTRFALIAGSLMIAALTFGTMLRNDFTIAWLQLTYAIAFFLLMAFRSWNRLSVDGMR
jgi:thiosulfate dehydrogenase [quinone] large subunit